jgi:hypothetical protein
MTVILGIILRNFLGAILHPLLTSYRRWSAKFPTNHIPWTTQVTYATIVLPKEVRPKGGQCRRPPRKERDRPLGHQRGVVCRSKAQRPPQP